MKGILVKADMIQAIVEGRKTQTRRVIKPQPTVARVIDIHSPRGKPRYSKGSNYVRHPDEGYAEIGSKYGLSLARYHVGETVYIKEAYWADSGDIYYKTEWEQVLPCAMVIDKAEIETWRSPLFMPEWAARRFVKILAVRAERLQEITEEDVRAEGITVMQGTWQSKKWNEKTRRLELTGEWHPYTGRYHFEVIWNTTNPKYPWESNPWVFPYDFEFVKGTI